MLAAASLMMSCNESEFPDGLYAQFETTKGEIVCKLEYQKVPMTVTNFVGLAEGTIKNTARPEGKPYYDGLTFHRVVPNFVIQGGDPQGNGQGGPGYSFPDEFDPTLKHDTAGVLSMANAGPGTNGSQFFITHVATPHLDGRHSVFGKVVKGMEVVNAIAQGDTIKKLTILRVGKDAKKFKADQASFDALIAGIKEKAEAKKKEAEAAFRQKLDPVYKDTVSTPSGLVYAITQKGNGPKAEPGKMVSVHYTGYLMDGTKFDSSLDRGQPISFPLGQGRVIPGWDEGISLLNVGSKATLIIPPHLAYGERGVQGVIPPNSTLVFEVELVDVK